MTARPVTTDSNEGERFSRVKLLNHFESRRQLTVAIKDAIEESGMGGMPYLREVAGGLTTKLRHYPPGLPFDSVARDMGGWIVRTFLDTGERVRCRQCGTEPWCIDSTTDRLRIGCSTCARTGAALCSDGVAGGVKRGAWNIAAGLGDSHEWEFLNELGRPTHTETLPGGCPRYCASVEPRRQPRGPVLPRS